MTSIKRSEAPEEVDMKIFNAVKNRPNSSKLEKQKPYKLASNNATPRDTEGYLSKHHSSNQSASHDKDLIEPKSNGKKRNDLVQQQNESNLNDTYKKQLSFNQKRMNPEDKKIYPEEVIENKDYNRLNNSNTNQKDEREFLTKLSDEFENEEAKIENESNNISNNMLNKNIKKESPLFDSSKVRPRYINTSSQPPQYGKFEGPRSIKKTRENIVNSESNSNLQNLESSKINDVSYIIPIETDIRENSPSSHSDNSGQKNNIHRDKKLDHDKSLYINTDEVCINTKPIVHSVRNGGVSPKFIHNLGHKKYSKERSFCKL